MGTPTTILGVCGVWDQRFNIHFGHTHTHNKHINRGSGLRANEGGKHATQIGQSAHNLSPRRMVWMKYIVSSSYAQFIKRFMSDGGEYPAIFGRPVKARCQNGSDITMGGRMRACVSVLSPNTHILAACVYKIGWSARLTGLLQISIKL